MSDTEEAKALRDERLSRRTREEQEAKRRAKGPQSQPRRSGRHRRSTQESSKESSESREERMAGRALEEQKAKMSAKSSTRHGGSKEELSVASRQLDRDSKRKARPSSRAAKPGVVSVSAADERSSRETRKERRSTASSRSTTTSRSTTSSRSDRDAKLKSRRTTSGPVAPGVERVAREDLTTIANHDANKKPSSLEVEATMVEEKEGAQDDLIEQQVQERMQQMLQQQQRQQEQQQVQDQSNVPLGIVEEKAVTSNKKRRYIILAVVVLVVAIIGGLAAYFATRSNSDKALAQEVPDPTSSPTPSPTLPLTMTPTAAPTVLIKYDPPNEQDCLALQNQTPVAGQQDLLQRSYELLFDVTLFLEQDVDEWLETTVASIRQYLVPFMAGCIDFEPPQRFLFDTSHDLSFRANRKLVNIRHIIANAIAIGRYEENSVCADGAEDPCHRISIIMDFFLKGEERNLDILVLLTGIIDSAKTENGMIDLLQLASPFRKVVVVGINSLDPTEAPSSSPSYTPSLAPTDLPSSNPSTPPPTSASSGVPTQSRSVTPTQAPGVSPIDLQTPLPAPLPSVAATPNPTRVPSLAATPNPTKDPTPSPTKVPTLLPAVAPTPNPTRMPTTGIPTPIPTRAPTPSPTKDPTPQPVTSPPTKRPTPQPVTIPPTKRPTPQPVTSPPTKAPTRRSYLEGFFPSNLNHPTAFPWLADTDTWTPPTTYAPVLKEKVYIERYVMAVLYYNTDGPNWGDRTRWLNSAFSVCSWFGCQCNSNQQLIIIEFSGGNGLSGSIPRELGNLEQLTLLNLMFSDFGSSKIPSEVFSLTKIKLLNFADSALTGNIPSEIIRLTALTSLFINDNRLVGTVPPLPAAIKGQTMDECWMWCNDSLSGTANNIGNCYVDAFPDWWWGGGCA